jgi:hypothetical protein
MSAINKPMETTMAESPQKIETSSLGNLMLILGGAKTRYVGIEKPVNPGDILFITRKDENGTELQVPVIVESVEKNKALSSLTTQEWHQAGHQSGIGYVARLNSSPLLHGTSSSADDKMTQDIAREHLNRVKTTTFTFRVADASDLSKAGLSDQDTRQAFQSAKEVVNAYDAAGDRQPTEVQAALEFAASQGISADLLRSNAGRSVADMRSMGAGEQVGRA